MPRALISVSTTVPEDRRDAYLSIASAQQRKVAAAGGNYWLFENAEKPGQFEMYFEAPDRETLERVARHVGSGLEQGPIYVEVKLN